MSSLPVESREFLTIVNEAIHAPHVPPSGGPCPPAESPVRLRVPIELDGSIWAADIEAVSEDGLKLVVDRQALHESVDAPTAAIRYQPENAATRRAVGSVTREKLLSHNRVRLNFMLH